MPIRVNTILIKVSRSGILFRLDKYSNAVNENLDLIQRKTFEAFENLKYNGVVSTIDGPVEKIKGKHQRTSLINDYL